MYYWASKTAPVAKRCSLQGHVQAKHKDYLFAMAKLVVLLSLEFGLDGGRARIPGLVLNRTESCKRHKVTSQSLQVQEDLRYSRNNFPVSGLRVGNESKMGVFHETGPLL
jgi:hypothetical protein